MDKDAQKLFDLDLPLDAPSIQAPPQVSIEVMQRKIEELIKWFPDSIPSAEERWKSKSKVAFELKD
jgi:hypothetical protein